MMTDSFIKQETIPSMKESKIDEESLRERNVKAQKEISLTLFQTVTNEQTLDGVELVELENRYVKRLEGIEKLRKAIDEQKDEYSAKILTLQKQLKVREQEALNMEEMFWKLTKDIVAERETSSNEINDENKTALDLLKEFRSKSMKQSKQVESLLLKRQNFQRSIEKLNACLKQHGKLADDGLSLTDVEHLQAQHETVKRKLEQRGKEVGKLMKSTKAISSKISEAEQKICTLQKSIEEQKPELLILDQKLNEEHKRSVSLKQKYERICGKTAKFKKKQSFVENSSLRQDYQQVCDMVQEMTEKLKELKDRYKACQQKSRLKL